MRPPTALTIAGSDPSGGAGFQADLKTFTALGVYGTTAITAVIAQNTRGVQSVTPMTAEDVQSQLTSVLDDIPLDATKLGMLTSAEVVAAVAETMAARAGQFGTVVLDPVMVATSGDELLPRQAAQNLRELLLPLVHVITPNLPEAAKLLDAEVAPDVETMQEQAVRLQQLGPAVVVLKGGHHDDDEVVDVVAHPGGVDLLRAERVRTRATHGTGCTLSAAIAAQYARIAMVRSAGPDALGALAATMDASHERVGESEAGDDLAAVGAGRDFLQRALIGGAAYDLSFAPEQGHGPVDHLVTVARREPGGHTASA
ncbi:bifunctional hydroxymethylpyrimidine kinase/phosphomethylpyrimidine kinase [Brachybacterium sp. GCM10030268]|uniref:bifunctional hydroxymethylpyrimidine kinase/phosphomethylpyrimidine kinase n=1 Tax=Brachybacterium sp. GCM10030268 TaxID=3273382 RepID=UPI00360EFBB7